MTLTDFVLARIAEREAKARAAAPLFSAIVGPEQLNAHLRLNDPAAVLADCEAKRRIIAVELATNQNRSELGGLDDDAFRAIEWVLRVLALPYADHPDYDEDWKP